MLRVSIPSALAVALLGPLTAQDTSAELQRHQAGVFALEVPARWRLIGPNEALALGNALPLDMREITPGKVYALGDVDQWLEAGAFTGEALLVLAQQFELPADEQQLREVESFWATWRGPDGSHREVLGSRVVEIGPDRHPALELEMRLVPGSDARSLRTLDYYASTMGQQLILSFRAWDNLWEESEPKLRRMADTLTFARPPQERSELTDWLLMPAILGAAVGIGLLVARKLIKQRSAPPEWTS